MPRWCPWCDCPLRPFEEEGACRCGRYRFRQPPSGLNLALLLLLVGAIFAFLAAVNAAAGDRAGATALAAVAGFYLVALAAVAGFYLARQK